MSRTSCVKVLHHAYEMYTSNGRFAVDREFVYIVKEREREREKEKEKLPLSSIAFIEMSVTMVSVGQSGP